MISKELIQQYTHSWRVFTAVVKEFDQDAWLHGGRKNYTPARLSLHILQSSRFYLSDTSTLMLASGRPFSEKCWEIPENDLPSQMEIIDLITNFAAKTEKWLVDTDLDAPNKDFPWAGETQLGVAVFTLRHFLFHLGELSSLLNESRNGDVDDLYVKA